MNRDLFLTLRTLRASGIDAGSEPTDDGRMLVWVAVDGVRHSEFFYEVGEASEWLATQALDLFPKSDFAKVARLVSSASAIAGPRRGRVRR